MPVRSIDGVVIGKNANVTTQTIFELMYQRIPIFYIDGYGKIVGHFVYEKQSATRLLRQLKIFRDADKQLDLSREIVSEKIFNQRDLLKRYDKTVEAGKLEKTIKKIETSRR